MDIDRLGSDPSAFRQHLRIDCDGVSKRLGDVLDPWQREDFAALDPAWRAVCGQETTDDVRYRAWIERGRGHSKTSDTATMVLWALFASKRTIRGIAAAADRDQAQLLRNAIETLVRNNAWLSKIISVGAWKVENKHTGSTLEIISSDVASSWGHLVDFIVCDEITIWQKPDLWHSLLSTAAKKPRCLLMCIGNAGFQQSWQWDVREQIRQDTSWIFRRLNGPVASWISAETLAEQKRLLPLPVFLRVWMNQFSSGSGDAVAPEDIKACITLSGPTYRAEKGYAYVAAADLGLSRDACAVVLVGIHVGYSESHEKPVKLTTRQEMMIEAGLIEPPEPTYDETFVAGTGKIKLCQVHIWKPRDQDGGKVKIEDVENTIVNMHKEFQMKVACDPWQASYLIERLNTAGIFTEAVNFVPQVLQSMCSATLENFVEHRIELFPHTQLIQDLHNLKVVERSYGCRLESPRGTEGHGDAATSLAICCHIAKNSQIGMARQFSPAHELIVN